MKGQARCDNSDKPLRTHAVSITIPQALKDHKQWVVWRYEPKDGRWTKVPYNGEYTTRKAKSNDPTTWASFTVAYTGYENNQDIDGIGFVPSDADNITGIDLDHCINGTGIIEPWAQEILNLLDSYSEITPSGHGLRIFIKGKLPGTGRKKGNIEVYDKLHYLTVTGHHVPTSPQEIEPRQDELETFMAENFTEDKPDDEQPQGGSSTLDDNRLIDLALSSKSGEKFKRLWDGDVTGYRSPSEADLALCVMLAFWSNRDAEQMDRIFRRSKLMRDKWDTKRGTSTYGQGSIKRAIAKCKDTYTPPREDSEDEQGEKKKETQADILMKLAEGNVQTWFIDQYREAHARFQVGNHFEVWPIFGRDFKDWLGGLYYAHTGRGCGPDAMNTALATCSAKARFGGIGEKELSVRVAEYDGTLWYDLADEGWRSIRITSEGWEIISDTPILFRRYCNTEKQIEPRKGGDFEDVFKLITIKDENTQLLLTAWLLAGYIPSFPHCVAVVHGPQGSTKTSAFRVLKALLDPGIKKTDTAPRKASDMVKGIHNQWLTAYDNLSDLPAWVSDTICRAVTGDGYSERLFYTNNGEALLTFRRVVAMNGINIVATRPDLLDRSILIGLERIEDGERLSEAEVEDRMTELLPGILGGAMDLLVGVLRVQPEIIRTIKSLPRMADFALFGCALAEVMGLGAETFLDVYRQNLGVQHQEVIDNNPVAAALVKFMEDRLEWEGSPGDLLGYIKKTGEEYLGIEQKSQIWPRSPSSFVRKINTLKTNLRAVGLTIEQKHTKTGQLLRVKKNTVTPVTPVRTGSGSGYTGDGTGDGTQNTHLNAVTNAVTFKKCRHTPVTDNQLKPLDNDGSDDSDGIFPVSLGEDGGKPVYGRRVENGNFNGSTWSEYETPDGAYIRTGYQGDVT